MKDEASEQGGAFVPFNEFFLTTLLSVADIQLSFGACVKWPPQARSQTDTFPTGTEVSACVSVQDWVPGSPTKGLRAADAQGRAMAGGGARGRAVIQHSERVKHARGRAGRGGWREAAGRGLRGPWGSQLPSVPAIPDAVSSPRLPCTDGVYPRAEGARLRAGAEGVACAVPSSARAAPRRGHHAAVAAADPRGLRGRRQRARRLASDHGDTRALPEAALCPRHCWVSGPFRPPVTCLPTPSFPSFLKGTHISLGCLISRVLRQDRGDQESSLVLPGSLRAS